MLPIFYLLIQNYTCEPLIDDFLFGDYVARPIPPTEYGECQEGSTVEFSKNITRFPKIIGRDNPGVPTDLMLDLRNLVTAKWRKIEFAKPFRFDWDCDGFEILEQYEELCEQELIAAGIKDPYEQSSHLLTDEGLIYLDLVDIFQIDSYTPESTYWEMILVNSFQTVQVDAPTNVLVFSENSPLVRRVLRGFEKASVTQSEWPMSVDGLHEHQMLSLYSGAYALTPEIWTRMEPWIESDYYTVKPVFDSDIVSDC